MTFWEFFAPDAQTGDAYGWLANQTAHFALGLLFVWVADRRLSRGAAFLLGAVAFGAWEAAQLVAGGDLWDGLDDLAFVLLGAAWGVRGGSWPLLLTLAAYLGAGVALRLTS